MPTRTASRSGWRRLGDSGIAKGQGRRLRSADRGFDSRCRCQCQHWRHTAPWHVKFLLHGNPERRAAARRDGQFMRMLPSWNGRAGKPGRERGFDSHHPHQLPGGSNRRNAGDAAGCRRGDRAISVVVIHPVFSSRAVALCAGATSPRGTFGSQRGAAAASASRSSGGA